jgi:hypothetical protein
MTSGRKMVQDWFDSWWMRCQRATQKPEEPMNKLQRMAEILRIESTHETPPLLTDLVLDVRSSINGSAEPLSRVELERILEAFRFRLEVWEWKDDEIDIAVRSMVIKGVRIIEMELEYRLDQDWKY